MWLKEFQVALVLKDTEKLKMLMESVPKLQDKKEIDSVLCLLKEARELVQVLQDETAASMEQMQKSIYYLKSTQEKKKSEFDVSS